MMDIGVGYYRISPGGNAINAIWYSTRMDKKEIGTGLAKGDASHGFPGRYTVTYLRSDGSEAGTFDLEIEKNGSIYDLSYKRDGELLFVGVGIDTAGGMAIGYRKNE
jgi:hypothetical protein